MDIDVVGTRGLKRKADDRPIPPAPKRIKVAWVVMSGTDLG